MMQQPETLSSASRVIICVSLPFKRRLSGYALDAFAQLYRDRADCENGFDELKNQWGWGGFTTQDIERCQTSARSVALVYNWWSWYCRAAKSGVRMEAITSRALLLAGVGRAVKHAGQTTLYLTPMHAAKDKLMALIANIRAAESCQGCCGAVASDGSLEDVLGLRGAENHPPADAVASAKSACDDWVTAGFRITASTAKRQKFRKF